MLQGHFNVSLMLMKLGVASGVTVAGESGVAGSWSYQFSSPTAIMFDAMGLMYILDAGNNRIQRWTLGMSYGVTLVSSSMSTPYGFSMDFSNNFVVADTSNHRMISFNILCRKIRSEAFPVYNVVLSVSSESNDGDPTLSE